MAVAAVALVLGLVAVVLASPVYKYIICLKYLFCGWKAVVPTVSALPAALGVFLLILVFAIMDGFANDTREMTRGTLADIIVDAHLEGIPYYDDFMRRLQAVEGVEVATPVIQTWALAKFQPDVVGVGPIVNKCQIIGIVPAEKAAMGRFHEYLFIQQPSTTLTGWRMKVERQVKSGAATPEETDALDKAVAAEAKDLLVVPDRLQPQKGPPRSGCIPGLALVGYPMPMMKEEEVMAGSGMRILLAALAVLALIVFLFLRPAARRRPGRFAWLAATVLVGVTALGLGATAVMYPVRPEKALRKVVEDLPLIRPGEILTVSTIPIKGATGALDLGPGGVPRVSAKPLAVVDYFKSNYYEADNSHVYVDFAVAQQMAGMEGSPAAGTPGDEDYKPAVPPRTTQIQVKIRNPADGLAVKARIEDARDAFKLDHPDVLMPAIVVNTWEEQQKIILGVVQMERNLTALMLGLMFIGFTILIGLISYVMAYIKSRDVGIMKAVGARDAGVGSLFLGYGFIIGLIGTVVGLVAALLMLYYLDAIELWLNATFGIDIFPKSVYYFEHIPRNISPLWCASVSLGVLGLSTLASMVGGLLAAMKQPVEALRYE
jgi:lipoprotein-releasing system permease protein